MPWWGPGHVVMRLVIGQVGTQVCLAETQRAVQDLASQCADQAFADRVHPRRLDRGAQDGGAGGLEDGVERDGEGRAAVTYQELDGPEPLIKSEGQVACCTVHPLVGYAVTPPEVYPAGAVLDGHPIRKVFSAARCPRAGNPPRGSRRPGKQRRGCHGKDLRPAPAGKGAAPARQATPCRPAPTARGQCRSAAPRSRAGAPAVQQPSPGRRRTPGQPRRVPGMSAGRRS